MSGVAEQIRKLEAMASGWDHCAASAPSPTYRAGDPAGTYRSWAAACRAKAAELRKGVTAVEIPDTVHEITTAAGTWLRIPGTEVWHDGDGTTVTTGQLAESDPTWGPL